MRALQQPAIAEQSRLLTCHQAQAPAVLDHSRALPLGMWGRVIRPNGNPARWFPPRRLVRWLAAYLRSVIRGQTTPIVLGDYLIERRRYRHAVALFEPRLIKDKCFVCEYEIFFGD